jgi:hypothetical protein
VLLELCEELRLTLLLEPVTVFCTMVCDPTELIVRLDPIPLISIPDSAAFTAPAKAAFCACAVDESTAPGTPTLAGATPHMLLDE